MIGENVRYSTFTDEILKSLEDSELDNESKLELERELNDIIIKLAK